jgi:hypothetical protein
VCGGRRAEGRLRASSRARASPFLNDEELVLADCVAAALVVRFDNLPRDGVNELLPQAMAGPLVDLPEGRKEIRSAGEMAG